MVEAVRKRSSMCEDLRNCSKTSENTYAFRCLWWSVQSSYQCIWRYLFLLVALGHPLSGCQAGNRGPVLRLGTDAPARADKGPSRSMRRTPRPFFIDVWFRTEWLTRPSFPKSDVEGCSLRKVTRPNNP